MVSFEEFKKLELVTAKIKSVEDHPKADKLFVLKIDIGTEEKTLVAGIKQNYCPDELIGKSIVVVSNLEPAEIRGVVSEGMLLAAQDENGISVLSPDREIKIGSKVR